MSDLSRIQQNALDVTLNMNNEPQTAQPKQCKRRSLFNLTFDIQNLKREDSNKLDYEEQLECEIKQWREVWLRTYSDLKESKQPLSPLDISILPAHQQAYLNGEPSLKSFVHDSIEFRKQAKVFLEYYYLEMRDKQNQIKNICEDRLKLSKDWQLANMTALQPKKLPEEFKFLNRVFGYKN